MFSNQCDRFRNRAGNQAVIRVGVLVSLLASVVLLSGLLLTGCGAKPVIGPINNDAQLAVMQFEQIEPDVSGIVYREVRAFDELIATSDQPILLAFYHPLASENARVIPKLEQLADDLQGKLTIVWIDAIANEKLASDFNADQLPQFTMLVDASVKRSLIGYDAEGSQMIDELIAPYLD